MKRTLKGFTLTEMIVAFILFALIVTASCAILLSVTDIFSRQTTAADTQSVGNAVNEYICDKLKYAVNVEIGNNTDIVLTDWSSGSEVRESYDEVLYFKNGRVYFLEMDSFDGSFSGATGDLYGDDFYGGYITDVSLMLHDTNLVDVGVEVFQIDKHGAKEDDPDYSKKTMVNMLNVEAGAGAVTAESDKIYSDSEGDTVFVLIKM